MADFIIYYSFQAWNFVEIIKSESLTLIHGDSEHLARPSNTKDFFDSCFDGRLNDLAIEISSKIKGVKCIAVKADRCNVKKADIRSNKLKAQCLNAIIKAKFNLLNCIPDVFFWRKETIYIYKVRKPFLIFALGNLFTSRKWKLLGSIASENFINNEQFFNSNNNFGRSQDVFDFVKLGFSDFIKEMVRRSIPESYLELSQLKKVNSYFKDEDTSLHQLPSGWMMTLRR